MALLSTACLYTVGPSVLCVLLLVAGTNEGGLSAKWSGYNDERDRSCLFSHGHKPKLTVMPASSSKALTLSSSVNRPQ